MSKALLRTGDKVVDPSAEIFDRMDRLESKLDKICDLLEGDVERLERINKTLDAIPDSADAVYVLPLMRFTIDEIEDLALRLNRRKLPSFSMFGRAEVERGMLVGLRTEDFWRRLARRMALKLQMGDERVVAHMD